MIKLILGLSLLFTSSIGFSKSKVTLEGCYQFSEMMVRTPKFLARTDISITCFEFVGKVGDTCETKVILARYLIVYAIVVENAVISPKDIEKFIKLTDAEWAKCRVRS